MQPQLGIITNPNSRRNRPVSGRSGELRAIVGKNGLVRETSEIDEIRPALEEFIDHGVRYWVSDGGDGTLHYMLNEGRNIQESGGAVGGSLPQVVPTNAGTVDFVAKKAGIKGNANQVIRSLVTHVERGELPSVVELDTLEVIGRIPADPEGQMPFRRLGFSVAIGGIGQRFFSKYYAEPVLGGKAIARVTGKALAGLVGSVPGIRQTHLISSELRALTWDILKPTPARVIADGREFELDAFRGLHAGSINVDLASVRLFPFAAEPGKLHFAVGDISAVAAPFQIVSVLLGKPVRARMWEEFAGNTLNVFAQGDELLDPVIDGECYNGFEQLEVRLGPKVRVPVVRRRRRA